MLTLWFLYREKREEQEREQQEKKEREQKEREQKQARDRAERERVQREAVQQHFEESLRLASQKAGVRTNSLFLQSHISK